MSKDKNSSNFNGDQNINKSFVLFNLQKKYGLSREDIETIESLFDKYYQKTEQVLGDRFAEFEDRICARFDQTFEKYIINNSEGNIVSAIGVTQILQSSPDEIEQAFQEIVDEIPDETSLFDLDISRLPKEIAKLVKEARKGDAISMEVLANHFERGEIVEPNEYIAFDLRRQAAQLGNVESIARLGDYYMRGIGLIDNAKEAVKYYKIAAEKGYPYAQRKLGECYADGCGVDKDIPMSNMWYAKAAGSGDAVAQYEMGRRYDKGEGVQKNKLMATKLYKKSAKQGNMFAQTMLAACYQYGNGVHQNLNKAIKWYNRGAQLGEKTAQEKLVAHYEKIGSQNSEKAQYWKNRLDSDSFNSQEIVKYRAQQRYKITASIIALVVLIAISLVSNIVVIVQSQSPGIALSLITFEGVISLLGVFFVSCLTLVGAALLFCRIFYHIKLIRYTVFQFGDIFYLLAEMMFAFGISTIALLSFSTLIPGHQFSVLYITT